MNEEARCVGLREDETLVTACTCWSLSCVPAVQDYIMSPCKVSYCLTVASLTTLAPLKATAGTDVSFSAVRVAVITLITSH